MSDWEYVKVERHDEVAVVTVDRQEKMNALNPDVIGELGNALDTVRDDDGVLGVILTGAGKKAFVAGADIGVLAEMDSLTGVEVSRQGQGVFQSIERFPKPVLAAVGGYALGGGCELALACHLRIASDNAQFGLPEVSLGIIPGYGGTVRLARLIGLGQAIELTLTGERIGAGRALDLGLVSRVVSRGSLMESAMSLMRTITSNGPVAVRMALESIYGALESSTQEAMARESALFGLLASTDDMKEGMNAFLEKREAEFRGQ